MTEHKQWLDLVTVGRRLGLDQGLRSPRKDAKRHLTLNERIARRVRKLIKRAGGLRAIQVPGVGFRVREDWLREYEIGLEMDAERTRQDGLCGQSDVATSGGGESNPNRLGLNCKASDDSCVEEAREPQKPSVIHADHKSGKR